MNPKVSLSKEVKHFIERFAIFGVSVEMYEQETVRLKETYRQDPSESDILWGLRNRLLDTLSQIPDLQGISYIYYEMATQRYRDGCKKDGDAWLREGSKHSLMYLESIHCTEVMISDNLNKKCAACNMHQNIMCSIREARENYLTPFEGCICYESRVGYCTCNYIARSFS